MFSGLIQSIGSVASVSRGALTRVAISGSLPGEEIALGESISVDGACLTVVSRGAGRFEVEASEETLRRTTLGNWHVGTRVNLERALRLSDRLGGHLVLGHVDAVSRLVSEDSEGGAIVLTFELPRELSALVVEKGSVAVDGVSLTVSRLEADRFSVTVIPETRARTTLGEKRPGVRVNLETDIIGKHVARLLSGIAPGRLSRELLERCGFV